MGKHLVKDEFAPSEEQMALWPSVSGNSINGLGETERRPPSPIYWHDPAMTPHGPLQTWMMNEGVKEPKLHTQRQARMEVVGRKPEPIAPEQIQRTPEENYALVIEKAKASGAELVGAVPIDREWIFEGYENFDYPNVIMIGVSMDYELLSTAPDVDAALAVVEGYTQGWRVAQPVANWIRSQGYRAEPRGGPAAGPIVLIPAALAAGFGELGKHGSIINRELGSNLRLAAVFTDLPLTKDRPEEVGADDFCHLCKLCTEACPVDAISNAKQTVRGVEKWYVDFDRCLPYFNENYGCAICLAVCPWSAPGRAPRLAEKMLARRARTAEDLQSP